jgi:hypothetical protein
VQGPDFWPTPSTYIHTYIHIYLSMVLQSFLLVLGRFFSFLILYTVGRTPWTRDQPVARPLPTHRTAQTQNKRTQTSMPQVGFEPTIPAFERVKKVHALDRVATVIGGTRGIASRILNLGTRWKPLYPPGKYLPAQK